MYNATVNFIKNSIDLAELKKGELWKSIIIVSAITGPIIGGAALVNGLNLDHKEKSSFIKTVDENTIDINKNSFLVKNKDKFISMEKDDVGFIEKVGVLINNPEPNQKPKSIEMEM